jgi:4-oxalocrotonate tautomerase
MPFANLKVPAGTLTPESKKILIDAVTEAYAGVYGERARSNTLVVIDEIPDGGWGLGGNVLTAEMLGLN